MLHSTWFLDSGLSGISIEVGLEWRRSWKRLTAAVWVVQLGTIKGFASNLSTDQQLSNRMNVYQLLSTTCVGAVWNFRKNGSFWKGARKTGWQSVARMAKFSGGTPCSRDGSSSNLPQVQERGQSELYSIEQQLISRGLGSR